MGSKKLQDKLTPVRVIIFGFLGFILVGAILLWLPISSANREFTPFVDALFTSTTTVCVNGLTTVTTAIHWSMFGKITILILIQLGGLGVVCVGIGVLIILGKKITIKDRLLIQTAYGLDTMDGMVKLVKRIIYNVLCAETLGAIMYATVFVREYGVARGIWYSIFYAVSAFCNAGMDIIGDTSLCAYRDNPIINITTMLLIISGGLGFIVWWDIKKVIMHSIRLKKIRGQLFKRLEVHSKLAISMTLILIVGGTFLFFITEYSNPDTIGNLSLSGKIMSSMFESVTLRTAGIITIPQQYFRDASYLLMLVLMLIGGSPMSIAGGIKTTSVAIVFASIKSSIKGRKSTEVYNRRIENDTMRTIIMLITIAFVIIFMALFTLCITEDIPMKDMVFEVISAISTAGLSRGITGELSVIGKCILCIVMFVGRIGPITLAMAFNMKTSTENMKNMRELAKTKILIG